MRVGHEFSMSFEFVLRRSPSPMNDVNRVYPNVESARSAVVRVTQYCTVKRNQRDGQGLVGAYRSRKKIGIRRNGRNKLK